MKILSWNVHGLGSPPTVRKARYLLKLYNPHLVYFMETKLNSKRMVNVHRRFGFLNGFGVSTKGSRGGLCIV